MEVFWDQCLALLAKGDDRVGSQQKEDPSPAPVTGSLPVSDGERSALENRMERLEEKLSLLLDEVAQIKSLLGKPQKNPAPEIPVPRMAPEPAVPMATEMALDFEDWLSGGRSSRSR